jgi:SLOG family YspA-like protein
MFEVWFMRLLITGSRDWDLYESVSGRIVEAVIDWIKDHPGLDKGPIDWLTIVHGNCPRGADAIADNFATQVLRVDVERHDADWANFGKSAGFRRNRLMVNTNPDMCLAFIRNKSKGATSCRDLAKAAGIATETFIYENEFLIYG